MLNRQEHELLSELLRLNIEFVVVGGAAVALHVQSERRQGADLDILISQEASNLRRLKDVELEWLTFRDKVVSGLALKGAKMQDPVRKIDILTALSGVSTEEAIHSATTFEVEGLPLPVISRALLIRSKQEVGEEKDLMDLELLGVGVDPLEE